jgi:hypothetical protein
MSAKPESMTETSSATKPHLASNTMAAEIDWPNHPIELVEAPTGPSKADDVTAVALMALMAAGGVFISWILLAPGALSLLK